MVSNMVSVWEWVANIREWRLYRSYLHPFHGEQLRDHLNKTMQDWRKQRGDKAEIFPYGHNPNEQSRGA